MITTSLRGVAVATLTLGLITAVAPLAAQAHAIDAVPAAKLLVVKPSAVGTEGFETARRGRGADDAPGHVRGGGKKRGRGADDGPNHS